MLDEPIVVIGHRRHVHQAFDEVLDELDVKPEGRDAGHVAIELVANLVRHEADLLPLDEFALGVIRAAFALGCVPRRLEFLEQLGLPLLGHAASRLAQRPVHDEIGIAPDGDVKCV